MGEQPSKKFGEYALTKQLGSGGFGEVWLARDKANQEVALKFLTLDPEKTAYVNLFKHEFELLCELRHAHLARVFDFGLSPDKKRYFFTQEFCPGQNFFAAMEGKPLEYFEEAFVQLLSALDYIHARGVVHFDIKADNIIVSEQEKKPFVKILDFGVAAKIKSLPELIGGTPIYMPPELIARSSGIDHRVDLYALGILILRVLTKKLPFDPEKIDEITDWHLHGSFPKEIWDGTSVPVYLREIIEKLLQKNPNDRFSSARIVLNFLNRTTNGKYQKAQEGLGLFIPQEGPLVGREAVLEKIKKELDRRASVIILGGEAGIGKTRLLEETRRLIELREETPVHLICQREKSFWSDLVSALSLAEVVMDEPEESWLAKRRVVLCMEKARQHPFSLLIDEAEKGGRELELFLAALKEEFSRGDGGRFFVLVAREQEKADIVLKKLSSADVQNYIAMTLGDSERLEQAAKLLHKYSGGLPLLMAEGLRYLAPQLLRGEELEKLKPPPAAENLYRERVLQLKPEEKELLELISFLLRPMTLKEIEMMLNKKLSQLIGPLESLRRAGFVSITSPLTLTLSPKGGEGIEIANRALALNLLEHLEPVRKKEWHQKIAAGMEVIGGNMDEIAYHMAAGGLTDKARLFYIRSGEDYREKNQFGVAARRFAKAVALMKEGSDEWIDLSEETVRLLILAGDYQKAETILEQLKQHSAHKTDHLRGWLAFKKRDFSTAKKFYAKALQEIPKEDAISALRIKNGLGNIALQTGKLEEARDYFEKSLLLEKKAGQEKGAIFSDNNFGLVLALQGQCDASEKFFKERIRQVSKERVLDQISLHSGLGFALIHASQFNEAIKILQKAKELAEKAGVLSVQFSILGNLVTALLKEGRYAEGLQSLKELGKMQERFGSRRDIAFNLLRQGDVSMILGMGEGAKESFEKGRKIAVEIDEKNLLLWFQLMESYWERIFGRPEEAQKRLEDLVRKAKAAQDMTLATWGQYGLADLFADLGKKEEGLRALEKIGDDLPDAEFMARKKLVEGRLLDFSKATVKPKEFFEPVEKICLDNHFHELLWEIYYVWGMAEQSAGDAKRGAKFFTKGVDLLKEISSALPEEYRDRYLGQRERQRLMKAWGESKGLKQERPTAGKIVSDDRRGPKSTATMTSPLKKKK